MPNKIGGVPVFSYMPHLSLGQRNHCCNCKSQCHTGKCIRRFVGTRNVFFYVRRKVDLMKPAKVNAYIMHIFGKIELLCIHAT